MRAFRCTHLLASHTVAAAAGYYGAHLAACVQWIARRIFFHPVAIPETPPTKPGPRAMWRKQPRRRRPSLLRAIAEIFIPRVFPCCIRGMPMSPPFARTAHRDLLRSVRHSALTSCFAIMITPTTIFITFLLYAPRPMTLI